MIHTVIMTVCWFCIVCGIILGLLKLVGLLLKGTLVAIAWCVVPRDKPPVSVRPVLPQRPFVPVQRRYEGPPSFH
jgi:hypothetical protein